MMIPWMKKVKNFQIAKVQPPVVPQLLLDFLPISDGAAYSKTCSSYRPFHVIFIF